MLWLLESRSLVTTAGSAHLFQLELVQIQKNLKILIVNLKLIIIPNQIVMQIFFGRVASFPYTILFVSYLSFSFQENPQISFSHTPVDSYLYFTIKNNFLTFAKFT